MVHIFLSLAGSVFLQEGRNTGTPVTARCLDLIRAEVDGIARKSECVGALLVRLGL